MFIKMIFYRILVELGLRFRLMAEYFGRFGKHIVYVETKELYDYLRQNIHGA